jgi:ketosteroid isomerase-like protein
MKKIIFLLFIGSIYACQNNVNPTSTKNIEITDEQKQEDIDAIKQLISNSFQDIWSDLDSTKVLNHYTKDFILLENGTLWNNDTIANYIRQRQDGKEEVRRINRFEFLKTDHNQNSVWLAYNNYAVFVSGNDTLGKAHWLESAVAIKENNSWKLEQLHSTIVR